MGLGKTLTALSLICWSLDSVNMANHDDEAEADTPRTTLIVAPKSSKQAQHPNYVYCCRLTRISPPRMA